MVQTGKIQGKLYNNNNQSATKAVEELTRHTSPRHLPAAQCVSLSQLGVDAIIVYIPNIELPMSNLPRKVANHRQHKGKAEVLPTFLTRGVCTPQVTTDHLFVKWLDTTSSALVSEQV
jgi:hypothetical protein